MSYLQIRKEYLEYSAARAYLNERMNTGMFLSLTGSLAHQHGFQVQTLNRLDPRIHTLLVQPSRSGKGAAMSVAEIFSQMLGLAYSQEVQVTDAGLVGTIDNKIEQKNREKGYTKDDPEFINPLILGALGLYEVLTFPEAKQMFKVGAHKEDLLEILQMVLDSPGIVSKRLANNYPIKYFSDSTIIGTTYFLDEFEEVLLKQGMFQRMMIFVDPFAIDKRATLNNAIIRKPPELIDYEEVTPKLGELADQIKEKMNGFKKGHVFEKSEGGMQAFEKLEEQRMRMISNQFIGKDREIMLPYTTALLNTHHKLATVAAILNNSEEITEVEVGATKKEINISLSCVVNDIISRISGVKPSKIQRIIKSLLSKAPQGLSMKSLKECIDKDYHINQRQTGMVIKTMLNNQELVKSNDGKNIQLCR